MGGMCFKVLRMTILGMKIHKTVIKTHDSHLTLYSKVWHPFGILRDFHHFYDIILDMCL